MATGVQGTTARRFYTAQTHYLVSKVVHTDDGNQISMGHVPAGSVVLRAYAIVKTNFNSDGDDFIDIGYADDADEFAADLDVSGVGMKEDTTTMGSAGNLSFTSDTEIVCQYDSSDSNNLDQGVAYAVVEYAVDVAEVDV